MPTFTRDYNPFVFNYSFLIELVAILFLHQLSKAPWVVAPGCRWFFPFSVLQNSNDAWMERVCLLHLWCPQCSCGEEGLLRELPAELSDWDVELEGLCVPNHLFPQQFPSPVCLGLLKFNLAGGRGGITGRYQQCWSSLSASKSICMLL